MSFIQTLQQHDIDPQWYLERARELAKKGKFNYETLNFSKAKNKKLSIKNDEGRTVNFGSAINGDYIIWTELEKRKLVEKGYANQKRFVFHRSHEAMKYDKKNKYSANNLSLKILW